MKGGVTRTAELRGGGPLDGIRYEGMLFVPPSISVPVWKADENAPKDRHHYRIAGIEEGVVIYEYEGC